MRYGSDVGSDFAVRVFVLTAGPGLIGSPLSSPWGAPHSAPLGSPFNHGRNPIPIATDAELELRHRKMEAAFSSVSDEIVGQSPGRDRTNTMVH